MGGYAGFMASISYVNIVTNGAGNWLCTDETPVGDGKLFGNIYVLYIL